MKRLLPYEFKVWSQHQEDGIIDVLVKAIKDPTNVFLEIGWGNGTENMTHYLMDQGWSGVGVDADSRLFKNIALPNNFKHIILKVTPKNVHKAFKHTPKIFDFFSLDIDSYDYTIAKWALENGYLPKVVCVEINKKFGPTVHASFPYTDFGANRNGVYKKTGLFGTSFAKYKELWSKYNYKYFTIDSSANNMFFYHPDYVNDLSNLETYSEKDFAELDDSRIVSLVNAHGYWAKFKEEIWSKDTWEK